MMIPRRYSVVVIVEAGFVEVFHAVVTWPGNVKERVLVYVEVETFIEVVVRSTGEAVIVVLRVVL